MQEATCPLHPATSNKEQEKGAAVLCDRIEEMRKNLGKKMGIVNFDKITPKGRKKKKQQPSAETAPQPGKTKPRGGRDNRGLPKPER